MRKRFIFALIATVLLTISVFVATEKELRDTLLDFFDTTKTSDQLTKELDRWFYGKDVVFEKVEDLNVKEIKMNDEIQIEILKSIDEQISKTEIKEDLGVNYENSYGIYIKEGKAGDRFDNDSTWLKAIKKRNGTIYIYIEEREQINIKKGFGYPAYLLYQVEKEVLDNAKEIKIKVIQTKKGKGEF